MRVFRKRSHSRPRKPKRRKDAVTDDLPSHLENLAAPFRFYNESQVLDIIIHREVTCLCMHISVNEDVGKLKICKLS